MSTNSTATMNNDWNSIGSSIGVNVSTALCLMLMYGFVRVRYPKTYNGRRFHDVYGGPRADSWPKSERIVRRCFWSNPFDWMYSAYAISEKDLVRRVGLDAYVLTRFCRMCARFCFFGSLVGCAVLLPVYGTANGTAENVFKLSASNLAGDDSNDSTATRFGGFRIWCIVVATWAMVMFLLYEMNVEYLLFVKLRQDFLLNGDDAVPPQCRKSIMVENIPPALRTDTSLRLFFESMFPGHVHSATVCVHVDDLAAMWTERVRVSRHLRRARATKRRRERDDDTRRVTHTTWSFTTTAEMGNATIDEASSTTFCCVTRHKDVDTVKYLSERLQNLNRSIDAARREHVKRLQEIRQHESNETRGGHHVSNILGKVVRGTESLARQFGEVESDAVKIDSLDVIVDSTADDVSSVTTDGGMTSCDEDVLDRNRGEMKSITPYESMRDEDGMESKRRGPEDGERSSSCWSYCCKCLHHTTDSSVDALMTSRDMVGRNAMTLVHRAAVGVDVLGTAVESLALRDKQSCTGFVTFKNLQSASTASQVLLVPTPGALRATLAPQKRDLIWDNVSASRHDVETRESTVTLLLGLGVLFWSAPVACIYSLGNLDTLSKVLPFLDDFKGSSAYTSVQGWLPGALLLVVLSLLPSLFEQISVRYEMTKMRSSVDRKTLSRYFNYQLANIYVTVILGSIVEDLKGLIDHPSQIMETFASSIPRVAGYFLCVIVIKSTSGLALELLDVGRLSTCMLYDTWDVLSCGSRRSERNSEAGDEAEDSGDSDMPSIVPRYSQIYGDSLLVLLICLTYAVLFPLTLPFGFVYFSASWLVWRYKSLSVHTPAYESGGALFFSVFQKIIVGLYLSLAVTITCTPTRLHLSTSSSTRASLVTIFRPLSTNRPFDQTSYDVTVPCAASRRRMVVR